MGLEAVVLLGGGLGGLGFASATLLFYNPRPHSRHALSHEKSEGKEVGAPSLKRNRQAPCHLVLVTNLDIITGHQELIASHQPDLSFSLQPSGKCSDGQGGSKPKEKKLLD